MNLETKLSDVLLGNKYEIETLDGKVKLDIPEGTKEGDILRIKNKGVPYTQNKRGDILINIKINIPKKLSKKAREAIEKLKEEGL